MNRSDQDGAEGGDGTGRRIRFLVFGVLNAVFGYALFWLALAVLGRPIELATGLGPRSAAIVLQWGTWVLAVVEATATMKYFVFRSQGAFWPQVGRAYFVYLPAQGVAAFVLYAALVYLGLGALMGQLLAVAATTVLSYFGHTYFTFRMPPGGADEGTPLPADLG